MPLDDLDDLDDLDELAPVLVPDHDTAVVTYCSNTANSGIAAQRLQALGYRNVRKYPGGKQDPNGRGLRTVLTAGPGV
jgi:rhodanese-related sulfurtransferase